MLYSGFVGLIILLSLAAIYFGLKMMGRGRWLLAWMRGTFGIGLLVGAVLLGLLSLDLLSYKLLLENKPLGTISFSKLADQHYTAKLTLINEGTELEYPIFGDQWQIDARIISWTGALKMLGAKPGYRLDRLSGRYYSLEDEHRKQRSIHQLASSEYWVDIWSWLQNDSGFVPLIDATYGSATYLPMDDGAFYEVSLSSSGLLAKPMNKVAENAVEHWR
ncbi:multidrug transporter [Teredinibacter haidensis]|uniref:multidrug transporter n=1 Tax=Teredinibacter haidensis TaxID=2731755 RepID=UPI0009490893|nr:multidrug transporter [Teredinibacter haidensis]